jgi:hypothetical protein
LSFLWTSKPFLNQRCSHVEIICSLMTCCRRCSPIKRGREFSATSRQTRYLWNRMDRTCLNFCTSSLIHWPEREEAHEILYRRKCFGGTELYVQGICWTLTTFCVGSCCCLKIQSCIRTQDIWWLYATSDITS